MPPESRVSPRSAQAFKIVGMARASRFDLEDRATSVPKLMAAMVEALEGYLSVTSPVVLWTQELQIRETYDFATDCVMLRADGYGYFDAESDGPVEIIDISPQEEACISADNPAV